jgi:hypothetical protein
LKRWSLKGIAIGVLTLVALAAAAGFGLLAYYLRASQDPAFFEDAIQAFEEADRESPPEPGSIVFVGSSSIRFWSTLAEDMKPLPVLNRGFGGSQMAHLVYFAQRIVTRYRPRAVVVYAGDNDLDARTGKTAETVLADYRAFVRLLHEEVPSARVYFLAIKPSKLRWKRWPEMSRANAMIEAWSDGDPRLSFVDTASVLLGPDGGPRDDVFRFDGLHLNAAGYAEWTRVVRPVLARDLGVH